jgi:integrase
MKTKFCDENLRSWLRAGRPLSAKALGGGLYFRVHQSLSAQFYFRYQYGGKATWMFLGNYPDMTLAEANRLARAARVDLDKGLHVAREREKAIRQSKAARLFSEIAEEWIEREVRPAYQHPQIVERIIKKDVLPKIGRMAIKDIVGTDIDKLLRAIVDRGAPTIANDALRYVRRIFSFARRRGIVEHNPVVDFTLADAGGSEKSRDRRLNSDELIKLFALMKSSANLGRENELAFKLLLALCVRKHELVEATWDQFDLNAGIWFHPGGGERKGKPIDIPLAPVVVEWLRELKIFSANKSHVLPARRIQARGRGKPHISLDTLNVALSRLKHNLEHFTVHDMRRTARTHLGAIGVGVEIAELSLNHVVKGTGGIYDRHDYFEERKVAMTKWASILHSYERGENRNVVPIRGPERIRQMQAA